MNKNMAAEGVNDKYNTTDISFREFIMKMRAWYIYFLSRKLPIIIFTFLGVAIGFTYVLFFKKPQYSATTTFVLEDDKGNSMGSLSGLASMAGINLGSSGGGIFEGDNILELYKSRAMIEKTLMAQVDYNGKKIRLVDRYVDFNNIKKKWAEKPYLKDFKFSDTSTSRLQDSLLGVFVMDIRKNYLEVIKLDKKSSIIQADVKSEDEFFAKSFNEQVVKNVNDFYVETKTKKSKENVSILQHKADSVTRVVNGAIYTASEISDATPNINPTRQTQRVAPIQRAQLRGQTNRAVLEELVKNLEMAKLTQSKEKPLIQIIDVPKYPLNKVRTSKLIYGAIIGFLFFLFTIIYLMVMKSVKEVLR